MPGILTTWTAAILMSGAAAPADEGSVVWQIGKTDHNYRDLAYTGDPRAYSKHFGKDVNFVAGQSDPLKDFSAIHPGPIDAWAGSREHPFRITFDLGSPPSGAYMLQIDLVDTHGQGPPTLIVNVNGETARRPLERGAGDISLMNPAAGKRRQLRFVFGAHQLEQEANRVELRIVSGSWLLYDALSLRKLPEGKHPSMGPVVKPSIFFVERDGQLRQELTVSAAGVVTDAAVSVEVRSGADDLGTFTLGQPALGAISGAIGIKPSEAKRELQVTLRAGEQSETMSVAQTPQRKWRIYVAPSTHTDIGYTDIPQRVIERHNRNTDLALELIDEFPLYHWNLESSWAAQMWLRDNPSYRHKALYRAARERRIGIEASYLNMLTGLCSGEELIRTMSYAARLHRVHKVPFTSYTLTDAPSHVWTVPSVLAGAGVRYLSVGANLVRAPLFKQNIHLKSPFWWEGPDGGKVLTWFTPGYAQAGRIGLKDGFERMRSAIERDLYWWAHREDYPYDAILLHGAYGDNVAIGRGIAESITEYSKRYAYPKVILCSNNDFLEYIEKNFADKIPTVRGGGGSWWEDGAASSALETGINRVAHEEIVAAETAWAAAVGVGKASKFPQPQFNRVWDNILLYDEHTWGAYKSITDPQSDFVHRQWSVKAAYATDAADAAQRLLERGLRRLASRVNVPAGSVLVFNASGRSRSGVVEVKIPRGTMIADGETAVPQQVIAADALKDVRVAFHAQDVPAVGYRTYRIVPQKGKDGALLRQLSGQVLENNFYRVTFDAETGTVESIIDRRLDKELVDQASPYKLGQLIYALGGEETKGQTQHTCPKRENVTYSSPTKGAIRAGAAGPVLSSVKATARHDNFNRLESETILYEHERRIDFVFRMDKKLTYEKEAVYLAFPIAGANPQFRYEIGAGSVRPNEDHFPGACRDWFSVQRWVTVKTDAATVAWSPIDTPLITLCDLNPGKWLDKLEVTNGTIFAYVMNNYWFTNYRGGQDGPLTLRYSLTSDASIDVPAASRFGEGVSAPLRVIRTHAGRAANRKWPAARSLCRVEPDSVIVSAIKRANDGKGLIIRLRETAGRETNVQVITDFGGAKQAASCDLVERTQQPLPLSEGRISLKIGANAMATIRLQ